MKLATLDQAVNQVLQAGTVIPAHPLALNEKHQLDEESQRRLTRYYLASGAGGLAVGVHTTQFEIRDPKINLFEPVLRITADEIQRVRKGGNPVKVAGLVGPTRQAVEEAETARRLGYDLGLVSMGGLSDYTEDQLIARVIAVAEVIPIFGFYLQPAVGGRVLTYDFWKKFADIPNVYAIKVAAFNRYHTLDVVRAVCSSDRRDDIAMYTGNDDNIIPDLVTPYRFAEGGSMVEKRFVGGLLGHWAVWTKTAVALLHKIKKRMRDGDPGVADLLAEGVCVTDMNAAVFDVANSFKGCIAGIHEVLRRQGLMKGIWCLNPKEDLSPGQGESIDRVCRHYPQFTDDQFVNEFLRSEGSRNQ